MGKGRIVVPKEYEPSVGFNGVIGRTFDTSEPAWTKPPRAPEGSPNVLFIILDDIGFGQLGCFDFTGTVRHVTVDVSGDVIKDDEAEFKMHLARQ